MTDLHSGDRAGTIPDAPPVSAEPMPRTPSRRPLPSDRMTTQVSSGSGDAVFTEVLRDTVTALDGVPFGILGGVASVAYGRPRWTKDIDMFVRGDDAERVLTLLSDHGFDVERTNPSWIYKGFRDGVLVDVIFKVKADVYFDDEMAARVRLVDFDGVRIPILAPEDIVVSKAIAGDEEAPWHWYDALGIIAVNELDWDYVLARARKSPNRVLSLMHYAMSIDLPVPVSAVRSLHESIAANWE